MIDRRFILLVLQRLGIRPEPQGDLEAALDSVAATINSKMGLPIHPPAGESLALSVMRPKVAALAFDRVYRIPCLEDQVPPELGFYCATLPEVAYWGGGLLVHSLAEMGFASAAELMQSQNGEPAALNERRALRLLGQSLRGELGVQPTIFYHHPANCKEDLGSGPNTVLSAAISNVALVDESELTWEQVLEFRRDTETRTKYRRLVRWIDNELRSNSPKEVEDLIALRLDDYEWALKKHGLRAMIGTLSCLLDPKFLATASGTVAAANAWTGSALWSALAGVSLAIGRATVRFGTATVDGLEERRKDNYEVAYIHELKDRVS